MNLYGRPLSDSEPIDPALDRVPLLNHSGTGDTDQLVDVPVQRLLSLGGFIRTLTTTAPTADDLPAGRWQVFKNSAGSVALWVNNAGAISSL